jgi:hypothetical protein
MMLPQLDNKIVSSFMLFIDHEVQRQGIAFSNKSGLFYPDKSDINGIYTYSCSYKQLCNDVSISGANVMSGVYLNNSYVGVGQSGLVSINHYDGSVNFNSPLPTNTKISGNFGVKEFSIYLSDQPDYKVVLDNKFHSNPKYSQQATGIRQDVKSMPAIILVPKMQETRPFSFAGIDDNFMRIRGVVICENLYQKVAVCGILKNFRLRNLKLVQSTPFDYLGNMTGLNYDYNTLLADTTYSPYIMSAKSMSIPEGDGFTSSTRQIAMVDFDISAWGGHL